MQALVISQSNTMSSKEIAALTGKEHGHILRDIRAMLEGLGNPNLDSNQYQALTLDNGMTAEVTLDKELTFTLVSGYSVKLRNAIVKRWQELEQQSSKPAVPQTYLEALKALVVSEEARLLEVAAHERTQTLLEEKRLQLDESRDYLSIKRVAAFNGIPWKNLSWRTLKGTGLPFRKIFDANYGEVNAYHHTAWEQVYPELELPM